MTVAPVKSLSLISCLAGVQQRQINHHNLKNVLWRINQIEIFCHRAENKGKISSLSDSLPNKETKSLYDVKSVLSQHNLFTLDRTLICFPALSSLIMNSDLKSLTHWYSRSIHPLPSNDISIFLFQSYNKMTFCVSNRMWSQSAIFL